MAKGQKKSSKEIRKPKQDKVKAPPATAGFSRGLSGTDGGKKA